MVAINSFSASSLRSKLEAHSSKKRFHGVDLFHLGSPGRTLSNEIAKILLETFARTTDRLYQSDTSFHWGKNQRYFDTIDHFWIAFIGEDIVGFAATKCMTIKNERVVYIDNMNIKPLAKAVVGNHTLGSVLIHEMLVVEYRSIFQRLSVVARTQNPGVYELAYRILRSAVYPSVYSSPKRKTIRAKDLVGAVTKIISPGKPFDVNTSVIRGAYPKCIYGNIDLRLKKNGRNSLRGDIAEYWRKYLDVNHGDALMIAVCPSRLELLLAILHYVNICFLSWMLNVSTRVISVLGRRKPYVS